MALKSFNELRKLDVSKYIKERDKAKYLPWAVCVDLLHQNGAEKVYFEPLTNDKGSSLFMSDKTFTDENGTQFMHRRNIRTVLCTKQKPMQISLNIKRKIIFYLMSLIRFLL